MSVTTWKHDSDSMELGQTGPRRTARGPAKSTVEVTMTSDESSFAAVSRTVVGYAVELIAGVERTFVGAENVRTAQGNAWAAMCADRARAQARADMDALVAALAAQPRRRNAGQGAVGSSPRTVGSSPRSKASHATLVSTR
ncbi:hypothetical protein [Actinoplanes sp. NPDC051859]|uniref:hypothetical protein n=1 Tax=Actinoplanes sp. NPDC051859 TaxID=3363909 RepID=UPI0037991487